VTYRKGARVFACSCAKGEVVQTHGVGNVCLRMNISPQVRKKDPALPETWDVRSITRALPNGQPCTVFIPLSEPAKLKAMR
jgi:hypothetical protein